MGSLECSDRSDLKMVGFQVRNLQTSRGHLFSGAFAVSFRECNIAGWDVDLFVVTTVPSPVAVQ